EAAVEVAGGAPGQFLRQGDALRRQELRADAAGLLRLLLNRLDDSSVAVAEVAVEHLREEVEVALPLPVEEVDALAVVELQDGVLTLLNGPGQQQMTAGGVEQSHGSSPSETVVFRKVRPRGKAIRR